MKKKLAPILKNYSHLLIERQENFSWLLGGRGHIGLASEKSCGSLLVSKDQLVLISNNIELKRLLNEEVKEASAWESFYWFEESEKKSIVDQYVKGQNIVDDSSLIEDFKILRTTLDDSQKARYRYTARLTGEAVEAVCYRTNIGMTEYEVAGEIAKELYSRGIDPVVTLIGCDDRLDRFRHFLPTMKKIERKVIISVVGRYQGLMSSVTRTVYFEKPTQEELTKMDAVRKIDAFLIASTKPGISFKALFENLKESYKENGYEGEWKKHHQGGLTGYLPREERIMSTSRFIIGDNQAYAWNPSVPGAKSEDTILIDGNRFDILSLTGNFPDEKVDVLGEVVVRPTYILRTRLY